MHPPFVTSFGEEPIVDGQLRVSLQAGGLNVCFKRSANLFLKIKISKRRCSQRKLFRFKRIQIREAESPAFLRA
ncbi:hypothetical protein ATN00_20565 (plasmid) [Sphingobium baderi]|uniref:Uncharacterized protein n=1 Tax=Sphingobium baderi TaxID=1332080 RepID=A0A0S3F5K6_9SPHN|nr:hypothetical protein ATN00_20565 [Sphingobium baderi]